MRHEKTGMEWLEGHDQFIRNLTRGDNPMRMTDYVVEITGTFRKQISITAPNEDEATMAIEDHPWTIDPDDIVGYEIDDIYPE